MNKIYVINSPKANAQMIVIASNIEMAYRIVDERIRHYQFFAMVEALECNREIEFQIDLDEFGILYSGNTLKPGQQ